MITRLWVLATTRAHCVESLSIVPPRPGEKEMGTGKLSCWEGKTDSFVKEE